MAVLAVWLLFSGVFQSALASGFPQNGTLFMTAYYEYYTPRAYTSSISGDPRLWRTQNVHFNDSAWKQDIYRAIDVHYRESKLFFNSVVNRSIEARSLSTGTKYTVFHPISKNVKSIAVDWTTNQVYWADPLYNWICMTSVGENQEGHFAVIVNNGLDYPYGLAVHPGKGYLFWTEAGAVSRIERATLSGKNRTVLATRNVESPRAILVDYATDLLYWSNSTTVERMTTDGANRQQIYQSWRANFIDIALYHELLFASSYSLTGSGHYAIVIINVVTKSYVRIKEKSGAVPLGLVMFDSSRQPNFHSACANKGCKEFCVNDPGGAVCICRHGKRLLEDGVSCSGYDRMHPPFFVYAHGWSVCQLPKYFPDHDSSISNNDCLIPVSGTRDFGALSFDVRAETIFTAEESNRAIYALKNNKLTTIASGFGSIHAMGVDWINSKIYWLDTTFMHIKVSEESGHHQHVLLSDLDDPRGLAVDAVNRRLFWCGEKHWKWYIRYAYLDGSHVTDYVIADERPSFHFGIPTSLTVDYQDDRLYWSDSYHNKILSVPLHGKKYGRIKHVYTDPSYRAHMFDFTTFKDYVVWTDNSPYKHGIHAAIKNGGKVKRILQTNGDAHGIIMYDYSKQPLNASSDGVNGCDVNNGGCEQLCLPNNTGRTCACGIGYNLSTDGVTCQTSSLSDKFVLVSDAGTKTIYQLSLLDERRLYALPFGKLDTPYAIDYDPVERRVYWSDHGSNPNVLKRASLDGSNLETLRTFTDARVDDLKIDPISRLVYIVETSKNNTISVLTLNGTQKKTLVTGERPTRIEVDYVNGYLYWATDPSTNPRNPRIMRSYLDGTHKEVLVEHPHDIHSVLSLSLDPTRKELYWVDLFFNKIERISLSGAAPYRSNIVVDYINHYSEQNLNKIAVYSVAVDGDHLYYSDYFNRSLWELDKGHSSAGSFSRSRYHEEEADKFGPPVFGTVTHIKIYNSSHHVDENNNCSQNNGGCSHHCLPTPVGATCACEDRISLLSDGRTCNYPGGCNWSSWSSWSECSKSCGGGVQEQTRTCSSTTDRNTRGCNLEACRDPVDGRWSEWSHWQPCSKPCGGGSSYRSRVCNAPMYGGAECTGSPVETKICNSNQCPVNGSWSVWSSWSFCSKSCGGGEKRRNRECNSPAPQHGGALCTGPSVKTGSCNSSPCPIDGVLSPWGGWSDCSVSCNYGHKTKRRTCSGPYHNGNPCVGSLLAIARCKDRDCPTDGEWSSWSKWTECSVSCGSGQKHRTRVCTAPQHGGKSCQGHDKETGWCVVKECPVHGNWSDWTKWSSCSKTCGYGQMTRTRSCTQPQHGGTPCEGDTKEWDTCIVKQCPVNGSWTAWSPWSVCSVTCDQGTRSRLRACTNPVPMYGGAGCQGMKNDMVPCRLDECKVNGYWLPWTSWSSCSKSCGNGEKSRQRVCQEPTHGGSPCHGIRIDKTSCLLKLCPVHGNWSQWSRWSDCSASCGQGQKTRSRTCTQSKFGGQDCSGDSSETVPCRDVENCGRDGVWRPWSTWSRCSKTCGKGESRRTRACDGPYFGGKGCVGNYIGARPCQITECSTHGNWSQWNQWSSCSVSCGIGSTTRTRTCTNPKPLHGGKMCNGSNTDTMSCGNSPCPAVGIWTAWEEWTPCSEQCNGFRTRQRQCTNTIGRKTCVGSPFETDACQKCNVVGIQDKQNELKDKKSNPESSSIPTGTIVGASVGGIVVIAVVIVIAFLMCKRMNLKTRERIARHTTGIPPPEYTEEPDHTYAHNLNGVSSPSYDNKIFYMGLKDPKDTNHVYETCMQNGRDNDRNEALYETLSHFRSGQNPRMEFDNPTYETSRNPRNRPSVENVLGVGRKPRDKSDGIEHFSNIILPPENDA